MMDAWRVAVMPIGYHWSFGKHFVGVERAISVEKWV